MNKTQLAQNLKKTYGTLYYVKNMQKSVAWFKDSLGLQPSYESAEWTEFPIAGKHAICLHIYEPEIKHASGGLIILDISNIREVAADLKKRGVKMDDIKEVHPGAYSVKLYDPDGNIVSLYEGPSS